MNSQKIVDPELFKKADWLNGITSFDSAYSNFENNVHIEAPLLAVSEKMSNLVCNITNVLIGRNTYKNAIGIVSPNLIIGRYCSIAFFTHLGATNHHMDYLSSGVLDSPFYGFEKEKEEMPYTIIGCDVWIGINATVIGGAKIGHGAVIGAGAVVTKEIPPYAIAVGSPARVIKSRFSDEVISDLLDLEWWKLKPEIINTLPYKNIKDCISKLKEIRKG